MKKEAILVRLVIVFLLITLGFVTSFCEIGVATAFNMKFGGVSYLEYLQNFYTNPMHFILAVAIVLVTLIVATEYIYKLVVKYYEDK